jgi:hypothetical protein
MLSCVESRRTVVKKSLYCRGFFLSGGKSWGDLVDLQG